MRPVAHTLIDTIAAPLDQVFAALTDPTRVAQWLPGCTGVRCDVPLKKGVRFTARFGARVTEFEIVDFTPPATFGWVERRGRSGRAGWKTFFHLEWTGASTALTIRDVWLPPSFLAWVRGRFFDRRRVRGQLHAILQNLRKLLIQ
jgi:uncharacterized protein YndB with AHSA1/START domain